MVSLLSIIIFINLILIIMATKKNTRETENTVEISALTLKALKGLLFDANGVDMSSIIDDLSVGQTEEQRDLMALNVGLVFKGMKPKIDESTQYMFDYSNYYYRLDYIGYSLITGIVQYNRTYIAVEKDGTQREIRSDIAGYQYGTKFDTMEVVLKKIEDYLSK